MFYMKEMAEALTVKKVRLKRTFLGKAGKGVLKRRRIP